MTFQRVLVAAWPLFVTLRQPAEVTRKMLRDKHNKKNPTQPNPVFPNWVYDRPALLGDFITSPTPSGDPPVAIGEPLSNAFLLYEICCTTWRIK